MPKIEARSANELQDTSGKQGEGVVQGAYNRADNTVYICSELLETNPTQAEKILTEEVGHALDAVVNISDAAGDEGAIFSKLSHGETISAKELNELRSENDTGVIVIDGKKVEVEFFLKKLVKAVFRPVKEVANEIKGTVEDTLSDLNIPLKKIKNKVKKLGKKIKNKAKKIGRKIKKGIKKVLTSKWLGVVLKVATFIPGIGVFAAVASTALAYAQSAYAVYQGIRHKSLGMVFSGVATLAGGASGLASKMGMSSGFVAGIDKFASYAGKASEYYNQGTRAYAAVKNGDVGELASVVVDVSGRESRLGKVVSTVARADDIYQAHRNGDTLGAITAGATLLQDFSGDRADKTLQKIADTSLTFKQINIAIENQDYAGALSAVYETYGDNLNLSPEARASVEQLTDTLSKLQQAKEKYESGEYLEAGQILLDQASIYALTNETRQNLTKVGEGLVMVDAAYTAFKEKRYDTAAALASEALGAPLDDKTKAFLTDIQSKAKQVEDFSDAVKSKDLDAIAITLSALTDGSSEGLTERIVDIIGDVENLRSLHKAIENKDYARASSIAADLATTVSGKDSELAKNLVALSDLLNGKIQISLSDIFNPTGATPPIRLNAV